jgi:hypothetical protein
MVANPTRQLGECEAIVIDPKGGDKTEDRHKSCTDHHYANIAHSVVSDCPPFRAVMRRAATRKAWLHVLQPRPEISGLVDRAGGEN